ncbi:MAG: hypothetical protein KDC00_11855 [Flavobacteriales bacterium]|nr:hypothetical protein [Flavobacteriales bacterium]
MRRNFLLPILTLALLSTEHVHAQEEPGAGILTLPILGRVSDADGKLEGCIIHVFKGNEPIGEQMTGKNGRFDMHLGLGEEYAIEFRKEGFLPKRVLVDTRADLPKDVAQIEPIMMEMSMLPAEKYDGADTDELDFPFAIIRYHKGAKAFVQDQEYTADMMRTNGALLLMSGRAGKE